MLAGGMTQAPVLVARDEFLILADRRIADAAAGRGQLLLTAGTALPVAADGETLPWGSPLAAGVPLRARVRRGALKVVVPAAPGH